MVTAPPRPGSMRAQQLYALAGACPPGLQYGNNLRRGPSSGVMPLCSARSLPCSPPPLATPYACMQGSITACDVSSPRLRALENLARQCGVPPGLVRTRAADLRDLAGPAPATASSTSSSAAPAATTSAQGQRQQQQQQQYDKVLLDAPCSGSGVMAKRADMRWRRGSEDVEQLVALQVGCGLCCVCPWCFSSRQLVLQGTFPAGARA